MLMGWRKNKNAMVSTQESKLPPGKYELVNNQPSFCKEAYEQPNGPSLDDYFDDDDYNADGGVMSGAILFIQEDMHITEVEEEMLIGSINIVSLIGAVVAGRTSDAIGRRWTMALTGLICLLGAAIMGLAPSFAVLMGGRLLVGLSVGFALMIAPVYTAEVSPASSRGALASFPEIFVNAGILLGYISNYFLSALPAHLSWRFMLGLGVVPSLFIVFGVLAMPESPRWLVMQNRIEEATVILLRTSDDQAEAEARLAEIIEAARVWHNKNGDTSSWQNGNLDIRDIQSPKKDHGKGVWHELFWPIPPIQQMLIIALGIQFFQQASGIDAVVYYSPFIFKEAGIQSQAGLLSATVAVGFAKTGFILVAIFLIDRVGRRPLLLTSALGMTASLVALTLVLFFIKNASKSHEGAVLLAILALCCNVIFFSIGLGPVCWVLSSEIFPLRLRAQAASLGVVVNRVASGIVAMTFLSVSSAITVAGTFFIFSVISVLCVVFIYSYIPETKGKTLEEIVTFFYNDSKKLPHGGAREAKAQLDIAVHRIRQGKKFGHCLLSKFP
eukprot:Gb_04390 [translate_table: standard]